eukprot:Skav204107  [mRNA]  locus=scaffold1472:394504:394842:+ [translate_table: standard]
MAMGFSRCQTYYTAILRHGPTSLSGGASSRSPAQAGHCTFGSCDDDGSFKTARAKEYGSRLCRSFADAMTADLLPLEPTAQGATWEEQARIFAALSANNYAEKWLPDYQPQR